MIPSLLMVAGLVLLFFGGEGLVKGSSSLALRLGLTPLVIGLTVVAFGTSAPEMVVSVKAALDGLGNIAIGNIVGSNIFNIGLILGLTAVIYPIKVQYQLLRWDVPVMIVALGAFLWVFRDGVITRSEGASLFAMIVVYVIIAVVAAKRAPAPEAVKAEYQSNIERPAHPAWQDIAFILGGLVFLVIGSRLLVDGASTIARSFGVSDAIIGLTLVSAGTSLPELAASLIAAFRRQPDIAIGNIVGSNIFNALAIAGLGGMAREMDGGQISSVDLWVMAAFSIALLPLLWSSFTLKRWEGGVLLAGYAGYLAWLWPR